ncbi:HAMP domain-containing sensor histidine kinase [Amycolatopsis australiensis]|uniref:histidine kinase n=1 Tax=Amycolatopsis australiensis TaxID=546364 RepID=A0A1K1RE92_9PSEU|nr:ATP-binding protein [Amycolatopsis australiensis]SFW70333.1 Signal transduction histidine kinase [Amycolatopsis australiensis]
MKEEETLRRRPAASWNPGTWRLRTKISVVLLLPVLVALLLAGGRVQVELAQAGGLSAVRDQMPVVQGIAELGGLADEEVNHDGAAAQTAAVDAKAAAIRHDAEFAQLGPELSRALEDQLGKLAGLRQQDGSAAAKTAGYHDFAGALAEVIPGIVDQAGNADLDASADIVKALMQLRTALAGQEVPGGKPSDAAAAAAEEAVLTAQLRRSLSPGAVAARFAAATIPGAGGPAARRAALGTLLAEQVKALSDAVGARTNQVRSAALRDAALVLAALLGALAIALAVARSVVSPIRRLHAAALDTARNRLPGTIERIREGEDVDWQATEPLPVDSEEEIGQLARAFDDMHRQAVRLAVGEQAEMRIQVSEMFMALSRRSQSLVELQLSVIEDLEAEEQDPQRLAELFRIDHIATRLRRNGENLQVLAGGRPVRRDVGPVPAVELLRAATSEVKDYQRVTLGNAPRGSVQSEAAADVVHILAELLENAIRSSPPEEQVVLTADRGFDGGLLIEVVDTGLGMTREDLEAANARLAAGAAVSPETTRRMGLFVVSRLAASHGITVRLRPTTTRTASAGITASVHVPGVLILVDLPPRPPAILPAAAGTARREPEPRWPAEEPGPAVVEPAPIFDQMLSHWFAGTPASAEWTSPADELRRAAEAAVGTLDDVEFTASGLPARQPGAQLAPGAAAPRKPTAPDTSFRDPAAVRSNLSRHYSGMRAARHRVATDPKAQR